MKNVFLPHSLADLWRHWENEPAAAVYAGGTDLFVKMRSGAINPPSLICLERIEELKGAEEKGDFIRIGSCATHAHLLENSLVRKHLPVLVQAIKVLGSPAVRNMGTIGGNLCAASPAGDTLPPLYALDAEVELRRQDDSRRLAVKDFLVGPGQTLIGQGEILAAVWARKADGYNLHHYEKVGQRKALAISVVSLASLVRLSSAGVVENVRLAWGSVGPTIVMCPEAEKALIGKRLTLETLRKAAVYARQAVSPISDLRADAGYRRTLAGNLLLRLLACS
ncbi:MAG: xanthine dehydrogenase family protein subunit M [Deltaproteobacteria bacterium]|nr:MAG: xanthine dehydrogenase family protein subunit M [Deltaproteobacteria bacterium]